MSHISVEDAQAWSEPTKLDLGSSLDWELEEQIASQVLGKVAQAFDTSSWLDRPTTPTVVRSIIAMYYTAWYYDRTFSSDNEANVYAEKLRAAADAYLQNILEGLTPIDGVVTSTGSPVFYPTDASSAMEPTVDDPSLGPPKFSMGTVW